MNWSCSLWLSSSQSRSYNIQEKLVSFLNQLASCHPKIEFLELRTLNVLLAIFYPVIDCTHEYMQYSLKYSSTRDQLSVYDVACSSQCTQQMIWNLLSKQQRKYSVLLELFLFPLLYNRASLVFSDKPPSYLKFLWIKLSTDTLSWIFISIKLFIKLLHFNDCNFLSEFYEIFFSIMIFLLCPCSSMHTPTLL